MSGKGGSTLKRFVQVFDIWCFICKHKILDFGVLFVFVLCCRGCAFCVCVFVLFLLLFLGEFKMILSIMRLIQHLFIY